MVPGPHGRGARVPHPRPPGGGRRPRRAGDGEQVLLDENAEAERPPVLRPRRARRQPRAVACWRGRPTSTATRSSPCGSATSPPDATADDVLERTYYGTAWSTDEQHLFYVGPRRGHAAVPGVAPPARHAAGRRRARPPGGRRALLPRRRAEPQRAGRAAHQREQDLERDLRHPGRRARRPTRWSSSRGAPDHEYSVDHQGDRFVILTNLDAEDFRVVDRAGGRRPAERPGPTLVPHVPGRRITSVDAFDGFVVLHEWHDAMPRLRVAVRRRPRARPGLRRGGARRRPRRQPRVPVPTPCAWSTSPS